MIASERSLDMPDARHGVLILGLLAALGAIFMLIVTRWGSGTSPDSANYIRLARGFSQGFKGLESMPGSLGQHAPLFSMVLSGLSQFGIDALVGARVVNAALFGANIFLVGSAVRRCLPASSWFPVLAALFTLLALPVLVVHGMVWSEPLFVFFCLLSVFVLTSYLDSGRRLLLVVSAAAAGMALLTRYAGAALLLCGVCALLFLQSRRFVVRLLDALIFGALGSLPVLLWMLTNWIQGGSATNRVLAFHPIGTAHLWQAVHTAASWLLIPANLPGPARLLLALFLAALLLLLLPATRKQPVLKLIGSTPALVKILALFVPVYSLFLVFSISFLDANTPLDDRILIPVYLSCLVIVFYIAGNAFQQYGRTVTAAALLALAALVFGGASVLRAGQWAVLTFRDGSGFSSRTWQSSDVLAQVRALPASLTLYSSSPEALYLLAGREALPLPRKFNTMEQELNKRYQAELAAMKAEIASGRAALVLFESIQRPNSISEEELMQELPLQVCSQAQDGKIYQATEGRCLE